MAIKPLILYSDFLVFFLLSVFSFILYALSKRQDMKMVWDFLKRKSQFSVLLLVLVFYFVLGLLDCLHFQTRIGFDQSQGAIYSPEVLSVLDVFFGSLRESTEISYSAPFALMSYVKDSFDPRLVYPPASILEGWPHYQDIVLLSLKGFLEGSLFFIALSLLLGFFAKRDYGGLWRSFFLRVYYKKTPFHWRNFFIALFVLSILIFDAINWSSHYHILGTDKIGADVFYMTVKSIRTGLLIGSLTTLITLPFALLCGLLAGYFGGFIDDVIQFVYTVLSSIPGVLLIAASILSLQILMTKYANLVPNLMDRADLRLLFLCLILGLTSWASLCRLIRAQTLKLRELDYVLAAKALGVGHMRILKKHIFPNLLSLILISLVMDFSALVLAEAVLSYVGVGVDPSSLSWGNMINSARLELARDPIVWWPLFAAFLFMFFLVLSANLLSDMLREGFDPRENG